MEVDWAGSTSFIIDSDTGEKVKAYVFVATLLYAEATLSMNLHSWITAHKHAYEYSGGVTQIVVPDNLKTKHTTRELILNPTYREMADFYKTVVISNYCDDISFMDIKDMSSQILCSRKVPKDTNGVILGWKIKCGYGVLNFRLLKTGILDQ